MDRVDALNWNTTGDIPDVEAILQVGNNPLSTARDDTGQPNFSKVDVQWLLRGSFDTNAQVAGYAGLSLRHLRKDFSGLAQGVHAGTYSVTQLGQLGGRLGRWQGLLTDRYNDILLTNATEADEEVRAKKAWASFVVDVLTAPIPVDKAFDGLNSNLTKMATTAAGNGQDSLTDSMLDEVFPASANLNAARGKAGAAADAGYSDGKAVMVQWAMENGMIEPRLIEQQWGGKLPLGITAESLGRYTVDPRVAGAAFQQFVQQNGAAALTDLQLDGKYFEGFTVDPSAKYSQQE